MSGRNFAADYTTRLKLRVQGPAGHHDLLLRLGTTSSPSDILGAAVDAGGFIGPLISNSAHIIAASYALVGSNAFTPLGGWSTIDGSNGVTYAAGSQAGGYYTAPIFRSAGGSRYPLYLFYASPLYNEACQFAYGDLPAAWTDLTGLLSTDSRYTGIDRENLISLGHADVGINDEVTAKLRR